MHPTVTLVLLENDDPEWVNNVIVDIFDVALVDSTMPLPHALPQLKRNIFLKVDASVASKLHIP